MSARQQSLLPLDVFAACCLPLTSAFRLSVCASRSARPNSGILHVCLSVCASRRVSLASSLVPLIRLSVCASRSGARPNSEILHVCLSLCASRRVPLVVCLSLRASRLLPCTCASRRVPLAVCLILSLCASCASRSVPIPVSFSLYSLCSSRCVFLVVRFFVRV